MSNENKMVYKRTAVYSTIVTSIFLAIITLFQEYGVNYIQNKDYPLSQEAKELSDEISDDKINYVDEVANQILQLNENIQTVVVSKFEPDNMLPKELNRLFVLRDRNLTSNQYKKKHSLKDVTPISDMPLIYYELLSDSYIEINDDQGGKCRILASTVIDDKNLIFGMYSYNSPSGWVGLIVNENYQPSQEILDEVKALTYRINLILF